MNNKRKDVLVVGMALFSMFFGAGNLIFPPLLGLKAGTDWVPTMIGFFVTGIGLPLLGIIASAKAGGSVDKLGRKVSPGFSKFLGTIVVLAIGPMLAIPRTGATAFEMGVLPNFPNANPAIFAIIYFGITFAFVIKPTGVVDKIGKILTPGLLILLGTMIIRGIVVPMGSPIETDMELAFPQGFTQGYQTMDALAAILFGGIVTASLIQSGYKDEEDQVSMTCKAGVVALIGLIAVYGGLTYLGATASGVFSQDITRTDLVMEIAKSALGGFGKIGLGLAVSLACLTTSVGLTATVGQYFNELSGGKVRYEPIVVITTAISATLSVVGVEKIVSLSEPILVVMYPVVIVLIFLTVFAGDYIRNNNVYKYAIYTTLAVSIIEALGSLGLNFYLNKLVAMLPLASYGFAWVLPAVIAGIIGIFVPPKKIANTKANYSTDAE